MQPYQFITQTSGMKIEEDWEKLTVKCRSGFNLDPYRREITVIPRPRPTAKRTTTAPSQKAH